LPGDSVALGLRHPRTQGVPVANQQQINGQGNCEGRRDYRYQAVKSGH
jgi:hypothetical protein